MPMIKKMELTDAPYVESRETSKKQLDFFMI